MRSCGPQRNSESVFVFNAVCLPLALLACPHRLLLLLLLLLFPLPPLPPLPPSGLGLAPPVLRTPPSPRSKSANDIFFWQLCCGCATCCNLYEGVLLEERFVMRVRCNKFKMCEVRCAG
ncbi:MAG: hypothetical protein BYD32DRAFT_308966 [Podila humilis]|nr:MAG: hypothetical protein BYD32DRAFT_308966 [Podila humilis]